HATNPRSPATVSTPLPVPYTYPLFAIGLHDPTLHDSATLPITTIYVVSESLGFEKGLGRTPGEAPVFVGLITAMIAIATVVAVIPGVPVIGLLVGVQVVIGVMLPFNMFFIWRLDRKRMIM